MGDITYSTGTAGRVTVSVPAELFTGFAIAKVLWNAVFTRNSDQLLGSPSEGVQVMVTGLALCTSVGVENVRALATEDKRATVLYVIDVSCAVPMPEYNVMLTQW